MNNQHIVIFNRLKRTIKIMKITILLLIVSLSQAFAATYAQTATLSISAKNETLESVLKKIEKQTEFLFFYNVADVNKDMRVSIDKRNSNIKDVLDAVISQTGLTYSIKDRHIVLTNHKNQEESVSSRVPTVQQQNHIIGGVVTDKTGEPIIGANIVIKGTSNGTVTDMDGNFTLEVPENAILQISYIGYNNQEVATAGKSKISVLLTEDTQNLDEVVVVAYGTQKKVNLTGSVSALDESSLSMRPSGQLSATLQGMAPGVTITTSTGQPGLDKGTIRVRGIGTLNDNDPLVLIDGLESDINDIDANDIVSMSILKDAAASSIYGVRAANGVILITTKRGESGKAKVSYGNFFGHQSPTNLPKFVGAQNFMKLINQTYGMEVYNASTISQYDSPGRDNDKYPDNYLIGDLFDTGSGFMQQHSLGINGGTEKVKYSFSTNYFDQEGLINEMNYDRLTIRLNTDIAISDKLNFSADVSSRIANRTEPGTAWDLINNTMRANPLNVNQYADGTWGIIRGATNPIRVAEEGGIHSYKSDLYTGNFKGNYELIKGLTLTGMVSLKMQYDYNSKHNKALSYYKDYPTNSESISFGQNEITKESEKYYWGNYQGLANYNTRIGKHSIGILAGLSYLQERNDYLSGYRKNLANGTLEQINAGSADGQSTTGEAWQYGLSSIFSRVNYSFNDKYLFEANIRRDGSSRFHKDKRWGWFPSFSAGWRVTEEEFMQTQSMINNLKLRASWGELGNDKIGNYPYQTNYSFSNYPFGGTLNPTAGISTYPNSDLTWETTAMTNVGLDFGVLSNKLNVTLDYYVKTTRDILLELPIPSSVGLAAPYQNAAKVQNKGWELGITYKDKVGDDFNYLLGFNLSDVKNKVLDLSGAETLTSDNNNVVTGLIVGKPINSFYGYESLGMYQTASQLEQYQKFSSNVALGDLIYKKNSSSDSYGFDDMVYLGSNIPRYTYGINLGADYKGFDFSALFQGVGKVNVNTLVIEGAPTNADGNFKDIHLDSWTTDNADASYPRLSTGKQNYQSSSFWVRSASYLRLKNIQLGYSLPKKALLGTPISRCRFYVSGANLLTFSNMPDDVDPEAPNESRYYPQVKTYTFGINIDF